MLIEDFICNCCYLGFFVIFFLDIWLFLIMFVVFFVNIIDGVIRLGEINVGIIEELIILSFFIFFILKLDRNGCINVNLLYIMIK